MHYLSIRHDHFIGNIAFVYVFDDSPVDLLSLFMVFRNIHTVYFRRTAQKLFSVLAALSVNIKKRIIVLFTVSDKEYVDKIGNWFGIARARTAADNNGVALFSVFCEYGNARKVEHCHNVGVT